MVERILMGPGGATEAKQDDVLVVLADLLTELGQKLEAGQSIELGATTLTALESITATIANLPDDFPDAAVLAAVQAVQTVLEAALDVTVGNFPTEYPLPDAQVTALTPPTPQTDALTDTELRAAPVVTRDIGVQAESFQVTGVIVDQTLVDPGADRLILRKFHLHADPALAPSVYPVVELKIGTQVIFHDKFEAGLPYAEGIPIFGGVGEPLTVSVDSPANIYINVRYELGT